MEPINAKMNRHFQKSWKWMVAIYLFLGGLGAGAYITGAIGSLCGPAYSLITKWGLIISWPAVAVGSLFLMAHLGSPGRALLAASNVGTSWISRGTIFVTLFMVISFIHFAGYVYPYEFVKNMTMNQQLVLTVIGVFFALGVSVYTGALLSGSKGVPFWRSAVLPILFMFSALVTGLFATLLGVLLFEEEALIMSSQRLIAMAAAGLVLVELVVIFFFLNSSYRLPETRESVVRIVREKSFVIGDLILGLILPFVLMLYVYFAASKVEASAFKTVAVISGILAIIGGLLLRHGILAQGLNTILNASGFEFKVQGKAYEKPDVGKLPPM
jgi:formate-dependent nitrite reductase membrane component NrfD